MSDRRLSVVLSGFAAFRVTASFLAYALIARQFGVGPEMDLYFLAVTPLLAAVNVTEAAGIGAAINFYARLSTDSADERDRQVAGLFVYVGGVIALGGVGFAIAAGPVAEFLGGGLPNDSVARLVDMLRISALGMALAPLGLIAGVGLLRARRRFLTAAGLPFIPVVLQVIALLTVANTAERLLWALVIGHALAALVGLSASYRIVRPAWRAPRGSASFAFFREALPLAVAELFLQGLYLRERQLAAALPPGSLSALFLGQRIVGVAGTVVSTGVEHTVLPAIAHARFGGKPSQVQSRSREAIAFVALLTVVAGLPLFYWPELWTRLAFQRGAFDQLAVTMTAHAALGYVGLYIFNALGRVAIATNFARGLGWHVALANGGAFLLYLLISLPLARTLGFGGLAIAASLSLGLAALMALGVGIRRQPVLLFDSSGREDA